MAVERVDPADGKALRQFVALDRTLWGHEPLHWSESDADLTRRFRGKSAFNFDMDHALFVFVDDGGNQAGRAVGYINRRWQRQHGEEAGFIGNLSLAPWMRVEQAAELLDTVESWLREERATSAICSIDGTGFLGMGIMVAEYETSPMFPIKWQPPSYRGLIEGAGYIPDRRFLTYEVHFDSPQYREVSQRALGEPRCRVRSIDKRRWKPETEIFAAVFSETFVDEWEVNQFTVEEFRETWGQMRPILDPRTWLLAEVDGEPAGFCLGMPDLVPLFRRFRGRGGLKEMVKLLRGAKSTRRHGLLAVGVRDQFQGRHIGQTLACTLLRHYEHLGISSAPYYWVDENNMASRRLAESLGAEGRVLLQCYRKQL